MAQDRLLPFSLFSTSGTLTNADQISETTTNKILTATERNKLDGVEPFFAYWRDGGQAGTGGEMRLEKSNGTVVQTSDDYDDIARILLNASGRTSPIGSQGSVDIDLSAVLDQVRVGGEFRMTSTQEAGDLIYLEVTAVNAVVSGVYSFDVKEREHVGSLAGVGRDWLVHIDAHGTTVTAEDIVNNTGNNRYVGTNASGVAGVYALPAGVDVPTIYRRSSTTIDAAFLNSRVEYDGSSGNATFTVPTTAASGFTNGSNTYIENTHGTNTVTLSASSGLTISGQTTVTPGQLVWLIWEAVEGANDIAHVYLINSTGGSLTVQDEGTALATGATTLNFTGAGVTASGTSAVKTIDIPGGGSPTIVSHSTTTALTLPSTTEDNTFADVTTTGMADVTVTLPDATATGTRRRVGIVNNRQQGKVIGQLPTGNTMPNAFDPDTVEVLPGECVVWLERADNSWVIVYRASADILPSFPANPKNDQDTFRFTYNGDGLNPVVAWTVDRDTTITLLQPNSNSVESFQLADYNRSDVNPANNEGYVIRNTASINWQIFGFASNNVLYVSGTLYTSASPLLLPPNNTAVILFNTSNNRWEGRLYPFLLPVGASSAGGASGSSGDSPSSNIGYYREYALATMNRSGADITMGTFVNLSGRENSIASIPASLSNPVSGIAMSNAADNEMLNVLLIGDTEGSPVWQGGTNSEQNYTNLTDNQEIYYDSTNNRATTEASGTGGIIRVRIGNIQDTVFTLPTEIGHTAGTNDNDLLFGSSGAVTKYMNKTVDIGGQNTSALNISLPPEVLSPIGSRIIVELSPNAGQTLTVNVYPRSGVNMYDESNSQVTSSSPITMNSANGKQIRYFELHPAPEGESFPRWIAKANGEGITTYNYYFNIIEYSRQLLAQSINDLNGNVTVNTNKISALETPILRPVGTYPYNTSGTNAQLRTIYNLGGSGSALKVFNIGPGDNWGILDGRSGWFAIRNNTASFIQVNNDATNGNFSGTDTAVIYLYPGEIRQFWIHRSGSNYTVEAVGRIAYPFSVEAGLYSGGVGPAWSVEGMLPTEVVQVDSTNTDRVVMKVPGSVHRLRVEGHHLFTGSSPCTGTQATGTLTFTANPTNGETVTIDGQTYIFQTTLTNSAGNVLIGINASNSIQNLRNAINLGPGSGTLYANTTGLHNTVSASDAVNPDRLIVTAKSVGVAGNSLATTETLANASWAAATMAGGTDADFDNFRMLTPSLTMYKSGSVLQTTRAVSMPNAANSQGEFHHELSSTYAPADTYFHIRGTNYTDITTATLYMRGELVVKEA